MPFPALEEYLARLKAAPAGASVWLDGEGRAQGRYFNSTLTSAFQPVRLIAGGTADAGSVIGYEGLARSYSEADQGLSLWKLLDSAANDEESIGLDRLCRMLHAINFFRQPEAVGKDLLVNVHARLLAAVDGNHGTAFGRILAALGLPQDRVVLQLPAVVEQQRWLLNYVADNYRRNGFRFAIKAADTAEALGLLDRVRPDVVKVDAAGLTDDSATLRLVQECGKLGARLIFRRVDNSATPAVLRRIAAGSGHAVYAQGFLWDQPKAVLASSSPVPIAD